MYHYDSVVPDWAALNPGITLWNAVYSFESRKINGRQIANKTPYILACRMLSSPSVKPSPR
jgi:hypothetical protein